MFDRVEASGNREDFKKRLNDFYDFYRKETGKERFFFVEIMGKRWSYWVGYEGLEPISPIRISINEHLGACFDRSEFEESEINEDLIPRLERFVGK